MVCRRDTVLDRIDRVQRRFLRELGFTEQAALADYSLAPLEARRDMAMMAVLHKVTLGTAPAKLLELFPNAPAVPGTFDLQRLRRGWRPPHDKQLFTACSFQSTDVLQRSLFGLVRCYNALPPALVASKTVKEFQRRLQWALRRAAESNVPEWNRLFSSTWKRLPRAQFDNLFS